MSENKQFLMFYDALILALLLFIIHANTRLSFDAVAAFSHYTLTTVSPFTQSQRAYSYAFIHFKSISCFTILMIR